MVGVGWDWAVLDWDWTAWGLMIEQWRCRQGLDDTMGLLSGDWVVSEQQRGHWVGWVDALGLAGIGIGS